MNNRIILLCFFSLFSVAKLEAQNYNDPAFSFRTLRNIPLKTIKGENAFVKQTNASLYLLVFLSPECPLCKNYSVSLNALNAQYKNQIEVIGIIPGKTYSGEDVQQYKNDYKISFPLMIDPGKQLSDYLKATITPEVVLVNSSGAVVYRGAIDDWVQELGKKKLKAENLYVKQAIEQSLQGKQIMIKKTEPIGCMINEF